MLIKNYLCHRVGEPKNTDELIMPVQLFERIIKYIIRHNCVVPLEELYLKKFKNTYNKPLACITFDDGFKDNFDVAVPILKKHGCLATFYVVTDCIASNRPPWFWLFDFLFKRTEKLTLNINTALLPGHLKVDRFKDIKQRMAYSYSLYSFLLNTEDAVRRVLVDEIISEFNDVLIPDNIMMSWEDLRKINKEGFIVGSHGKSHALLARIDNESVLYDEINGSAETIKKMLGFRPISISYPRNNYDRRVIDACVQSGYKLGLAVGQDFFNPLSSSLFEIPRIDFYGGLGGWPKTWMRINCYSGKLRRLVEWRKRK